MQCDTSCVQCLGLRNKDLLKKEACGAILDQNGGCFSSHFQEKSSRTGVRVESPEPKWDGFAKTKTNTCFIKTKRRFISMMDTLHTIQMLPLDHPKLVFSKSSETNVHFFSGSNFLFTLNPPFVCPGQELFRHRLARRPAVSSPALCAGSQGPLGGGAMWWCWLGSTVKQTVQHEMKH